MRDRLMVLSARIMILFFLITSDNRRRSDELKVTDHMLALCSSKKLF